MGTDQFIKYGLLYLLCILATVFACYLDWQYASIHLRGFLCVLGLKSISGLLAFFVSEKYLRLYTISYLTGMFFLLQIIFSCFVFWAFIHHKNLRWP